MERNKILDDMDRSSFIETFKDKLIRKDNKTAAFEFEHDGNTLILNKPLKDFLDMLDIFYSDYSVQISRTCGHPTLQVFLRLEEGLWRPK
jgi:hypothetical protein